MFVMVGELKKRHNDQHNTEEQPAIKITDAFYIATVDTFQNPSIDNGPRELCILCGCIGEFR